MKQDPIDIAQLLCKAVGVSPDQTTGVVIEAHVGHWPRVTLYRRIQCVDVDVVEEVVSRYELRPIGGVR